jgi:hypothetical protein
LLLLLHAASLLAPYEYFTIKVSVLLLLLLRLLSGAAYGQELPPQQMEAVIAAGGRTPCQRTTLYGRPQARQTAASFAAPELQPVNMGSGRRQQQQQQQQLGAGV